MELKLFEQVNRKYQRHPDSLSHLHPSSRDPLRPVTAIKNSGQSSKLSSFEKVLNRVQDEMRPPNLQEISQGAHLKIGHSGPSVQYIRSLMRKLDISVPAQGNYGRELAYQVGKFQEEHGLAVKDSPFWGKVGPETLSRLEKEANKPRYDEALGQNMVNFAKNNARGRSIRRCYAFVAKAIHKNTGPFLQGGHAYMAADYLSQSPYFKEVEQPQTELDKLPVGAVVVWDRGRSRSGHISIADGQGNEVSDHIAPQMKSHYGGGSYRVFLPVQPTQS